MLSGLAALRCAICRQLLLLEQRPNVDVSLVGEFCHIIARKTNGPRGRKGLTEKELDSYANLIFLCQPHHKLIDDHPGTYTVERLIQLKQGHEDWVRTELAKLQPWDYNLSQITYLNVPRLSILAAIYGYRINLPLKEGQSLHSLGWELNHVLLEFSKLLREIHPLAKELPDLSDPEDRLIGLTFNFNNRFRTRNMPYPDRSQLYTNYLKGNLKHDPHIYRKFGEWKLALTINPQWITTTTAYSEFIPSGGHNRFAGLCTIKAISYETKFLHATPLVLGFPKTEFNDWLTDGLRAASA